MKVDRSTVGLVSSGAVFATAPTIGFIGTPKVDQRSLFALDAKTGKIGPQKK